MSAQEVLLLPGTPSWGSGGAAIACKELDSVGSNGGPEREPGREATGSTNATEQADTTRKVSSWRQCGRWSCVLSSLSPQIQPNFSKQKAEPQMNRTNGPNLARRAVLPLVPPNEFFRGLKQMPIGSEAEDADISLNHRRAMLLRGSNTHKRGLIIFWEQQREARMCSVRTKFSRTG
jgi:hypothetical protein